MDGVVGDLWSYDYYKGQFVVSPDPDVSVMTVEPGRHRCLILGSDGLWNMLSPAEAVSVVTDLEMHFEDRVIHDPVSDREVFSALCLCTDIGHSSVVSKHTVLMI